MCTCSHKKKRMRQIKKMAQRGLLDPEQEDPFSLFVASTDIRYCYYHDTHKILGNTFGMCVLQVCITFCLLCLAPQCRACFSIFFTAKHACAPLLHQLLTTGWPPCKEALLLTHVFLHGWPQCKEAPLLTHVFLPGANSHKHIQLSTLICHRTLRP